MKIVKSKSGLTTLTTVVVGISAFGACAYFTTSGLSLPLSARGLGVLFQVSVLLLVSAVLVRASVAAGGSGGGHAGLRAWRVCGSAFWPSPRLWRAAMLACTHSGQGGVCRGGACLIPAYAGGR